MEAWNRKGSDAPQNTDRCTVQKKRKKRLLSPWVGTKKQGADPPVNLTCWWQKPSMGKKYVHNIMKRGKSNPGIVEKVAVQYQGTKQVVEKSNRGAAG